MKLIFLSILVIILVSGSCYAHPVSFEGGTMFTSSYSKDWIENSASYTFSPTSSYGLDQFRISDTKESRDYLIPRISTRFRKNGLSSQSNLYFTSGLGSRLDSNSSRLTGLLGVQADYETRKIYTLGLAETLLDGDGRPRTHLQYRFGVAPYKANFKQLASWIIGQVDYRAYKENSKLTMTPMARFFYKNVLFEAGIDFDKNISTVFMYNF